MSMSDPIADMLTRIRNALLRRHPSVAMPHSKIKENIANVLKSEGYIEDYTVVPEQPQPVLQLQLKYTGSHKAQRSMITKLERVSKPGRRIYVKKNEIPWVVQGMGVAILTTSKGVMTGQSARRHNLGGELLCKVY